jgi:hypothetical protein
MTRVAARRRGPAREGGSAARNLNKKRTSLNGVEHLKKLDEELKEMQPSA